ncbi:hypothetical protein [Streptomyces sp. NPDC054842]
MTGNEDRQDDRYARARDQDEPGSHSGAERQAQERTVPGTASAREGYGPDRGISAGDPLEGVERHDRERGTDAEDGSEGG